MHSNIIMSIFCMVISATLLLISIVVNLVIYMLHPLQIQYHSYSKIGTVPPGPKPIPIFGCLIQMLTQNKPPYLWIHQFMHQMDTEIACIRICGVNLIPVTSPELAREFLKTQDAIFTSRPYGMSARIATLGFKAVFSSTGDHWKKMKRVMVTQVLAPAKHKMYHDKRIGEADHLVRYVFNLAKDGLVVNVRTAVQHYCGNVSRRLVFNKRFFGQGTANGGPGVEEEEHVDAIFTVIKHIYALSISDYAWWLEMFDFDGHKGYIAGAVEKISKYHDTEIHQRVQAWRNGVKQKEEDILDVFINLKDDANNPLLTVEEIKGEIMEIMLAAVDNPSNAVEWAMLEMINQSDILIKAQQEVDNVVGKKRLVQESDLPELNFVRACAKEALRLHPIAPFNPPHVSTQDTIVSGYFIPRGSQVLLSRYGLGRNPRIWKEPLKFMPKRHFHDDIDSQVTLADPELNMLSFSTGRRGCPAVLLGSTITTMLLARLVQGFDWSIPSDELRINGLVESEGHFFHPMPLRALAKPRLEDEVYKQLYSQ